MRFLKIYGIFNLQDLEYIIGGKNENVKNKNNILSGMAAITKKSAFLFGNMNCGWWNYQPKTPKAVKKQNKA